MRVSKHLTGKVIYLVHFAGLLLVASQHPADAATTYEPYLFETIAGNPTNGTFQNGTNLNAHFPDPIGIALDSVGNLYVGDYNANRVRKVTHSGTNWITTTIAGSGALGSADGTNFSATFGSVNGITIDTNGTLYVADSGQVRKIENIGTNWVVTTIASGVGAEYGLALDSHGRFVFCDGGSVIYMLSKSGTNWVRTAIAGTPGLSGNVDGTNSAARFSQPDRVVVDSADNLYVSDFGNHEIRKLTQIDTNWVVTTIAGRKAISFQDGPATNSLLGYPEGLAVDAAHNVYFGDTYNSAIRKITPDGIVTTLGGKRAAGYNDGIGPQALIPDTLGIAVENSGTLYIAEGLSSHMIKRARRACAIITNSTPLQPSGFILSATVAPGIHYRLQASSNLIDWIDLTNFVPSDSTFQYQESTSVPTRLYRLSSP